MKRIFLLSLLISTVFYSSFSQQHRKSVNVTVYNNDLGVVKDTRDVELKSGISELRIVDVAERIDPTSVHIKLDGKVLEQNFQYDLVSMFKILFKYVDKKIQLTSKDGKFIEGTLLSINNNQFVLQKEDGGLLMLPKLDDFQIAVGALPEGLITKPALVWKVDSKKDGKQETEISYQTAGMTWHAEYVAVLNKDDSKMDLNSWVSIENRSGATYPEAKLKLVAGDVNMVDDYNIRGGRGKGVMLKAEVMSDRQFEEKSFFEYHIYNLQRPATIANNEVKQISLFEASNISIKKKFLLQTSSYNQEKMKVAVVVEFENKDANNLGMPMPKGKVRLYKSDGQSIEFIGEDMIDHTPKNEKLKLKVGDAFDVVAEQKMEDEKRISDRVSEMTYSVTIKNRKTDDIEVEVLRYLGTGWDILKSNIKWEKKAAQNVIFKVPVKAGEEVELNYKVRFSY